MTDLTSIIVNALVATKKWSAETAALGVSASFKCEYCDRDLLESPDAYKLWQVDHIAPLSKGGSDIVDNKAIACRQCNMDFKRNWDPRTVISGNGQTTRETLVVAVRTYVRGRREITQTELQHVRKLLIETPDVVLPSSSPDGS